MANDRFNVAASVARVREGDEPVAAALVSHLYPLVIPFRGVTEETAAWRKSAAVIKPQPLIAVS